MQNYNNIRGAGRKRSLSDDQIAVIAARRDAGEQVCALAQEYGVSRQTLSKYLNNYVGNTACGHRSNYCTSALKWRQMNADFKRIDVDNYTMRMDFMYRDEVCTEILVDFTARQIMIRNRTTDIIHRAFGVKAKPTWQDFEDFLEERCVPRTRDCLNIVLDDYGLDFYDPLAIVEVTKGQMAEDSQWIRITYYAKQMEKCHISHDRT